MNMQNIPVNGFRSIKQLQNEYLQTKTVSPKAEENTVSFQDILLEKQADSTNLALRFSKHASNRLSDRNISLSLTQMDKLQNGASIAKEKGIKESLVVVDELAFIVNIPNNTVITAMGRDESRGNVFTNIDGAIFM